MLHKANVSKTFGYYVGRPNPLGNPFSHLPDTLARYRVTSAKEAVAHYRLWLENALRTSPDVIREFNKLQRFLLLGPITVFCPCKSSCCHAVVIVEKLNLIE